MKCRFVLAISPLVIAFVLGLRASDAPAAAPPHGDSAEPDRVAAAPAAAPGPSCPEGMVSIPGGTYVHGPDSAPAAVQSFCLDATEVTVDSYKRCVDRGACTEPNPLSATGRDQLCNWSNPGRGLHPVNCVDWYQASTYCGSVGRRLPSQPEWTWATHNGREDTAFPWGYSAPNPSLVNMCGHECWPSVPAKIGWIWQSLEALGEGPLYPGDDGFPETAPVGSFPKGDTNRWGVHDLWGNVTEWTSTRHDRGGDRFVISGGNFMIRGDGVRPSPYRGHLAHGSRLGPSEPPSERSSVLGFRCALQDFGSSDVEPNR